MLSDSLKRVNLFIIMGLMSKSSRSKYFIGVVLLLAASASFIRSSHDVLKSKDRLENVTADVQKLEEKKARLEQEVNFKKTNEYVEEKARNELNLIKEGEKIYVVKWDKSTELQKEDVLSTTDAGGVDTKVVSNWYSWYLLFFGK